MIRHYLDRAILAAAALILCAGLMLDHAHRAALAAPAAAMCDTDSDCLRLCRADDADCDGGPQD